MTKKLTRQRAWQIYQIANNCCQLCGQPARQKRDGTFSVYCPDHAAKHNLLAKNRYRRKQGLPLATA